MRFVQPTPKDTRALAHTQMSPGWQGTDELLTREIAAATQRLLGARDTAEVHELRGYITALQSFQQDVREARDKLAKQGQDVPL